MEIRIRVSFAPYRKPTSPSPMQTWPNGTLEGQASKFTFGVAAEHFLAVTTSWKCDDSSDYAPIKKALCKFTRFN